MINVTNGKYNGKLNIASCTECLIGKFGWYHIFMTSQIRRISLHDSAMANFVERMIRVSHESKQFDFSEEWISHLCVHSIKSL